MNKASQHPLQSDFGFSSPSFTVDKNGNIVANSIVFRETIPDTIDFAVTDDSTGALLITGLSGTYPSITMTKGRSYNISLALDLTQFYIYEQDQTTLYTKSITHSDNSSGVNVHGKTKGTITITIPEAFTSTILYYTNQSENQFGTITVVDPAGLFSTVNISGSTDATSSSDGVFTVNGGVGIKGNVFLNKNLNFDSNQEVNITSLNKLSVNSNTDIDFKINSTVIGSINSAGSNIPVINTTIQNATITNSTIDNTVIGNSNPSTAIFSSAKVLNTGTDVTSVTNKTYVDNTALSYAITFGI